MTSAASSSIIVCCWLIFLFYWLVSALAAKATLEKKSLLSSLSYRIPAVLGGLLLWGRRQPHPLNEVLLPRTELTQTAGVIVCIAGLLLAIWARRTLGGNWSSTVTFKQGHELVKTGPYRLVRHPIYSALLLMCLGSAIEIGRLRGVFALLLIGLCFWIKLQQEETLMLRHFPDQYPAYRKEVRALIPFVL